jgi:cytochrome c-type protein NapC
VGETKQPSGRRSWWVRFWQPGNKWLLGFPVGAFVVFFAGAITLIGSQVALHLVNTEQFCTDACHSMVFPTEEWRNSPHYSNASGVRATCPDCHVPSSYPEKLIVKTRAGIVDFYNEVKGTMATREKYEANRARLAEHVWDYMEKTDSRECRNCHSEENFLLKDQEEKAAKAHITGPLEGKTCIDCHKGIAHKTPDEIAEEQQGLSAR